MSKVRLTGSTSGYAEITAPAVAGNNTVTLPSSNGSVNQLLKNGATPGTLEYSTVSIGSTGELDKITAINGGPLAGFRNRIINGNFDIWQRGTSFSPTDNTYTADRWAIVFDGTGATRTISRQGFSLGQTDVPREPEYFVRFAQSVAGSGSTRNRIDQRIEDVRTLAGQQVTISFWAKAAASTTMPSVVLQQYFGTGGSPSANVDTTAGISLALTTSWQKFSYSVSLPSISGKTLGTDGIDSLVVLFNMPLNATFTIDIAQVQLEPGPVATPFEQRPIGTELSLCQRYCFVAPANWLAAKGGISTGVGDFSVLGAFPTTMRVPPTASGVTFATSNCGTPSLMYLTSGSASYGTVSSASGGALFNLTAGTYSAEL
tara:strand:+ start:2498 stop:3619 length:1122 start_codon:yes stop_codon:yes gene_type:complete